jgi:hypothetical protein
MTTIIASIVLGVALACGAYTGRLWVRDAIANSKRESGHKP